MRLEAFDDRLVVTSPGSLPNRMTVESVTAGSRPKARNEMMVHALLVAGLTERRGGGWPTIRGAMQSFNGTEPELLHDRGNRVVQVTLRLASASVEGEE